MIDQIAELNRVLLMINSLTVGRQAIERKTVIEECQSIAIEGRMPEHADSIDFAVEISLLHAMGKKKVLLNHDGLAFINLNPAELFDLTDQQQKYLLRWCFFDGVFKKETKECLKCFEKSEKKETFTWSAVDGQPFGKYHWIVPYLEQLDLLWRRKQNLTVRKEYTTAVAEFISEPKGWTEKQHFEYMMEKKELGDLAEDLIRKWEVERLENAGHAVEAHCVKLISKLDVGAGFDIKSFNGKSKGMHFNRFIEVKGSKGPGMRFFWSENEMKVAKDLGDKYWIYYQGGVKVETGTALYEPILYKNPLVSIKADSKLTVRENGVVVEGKVPAKTRNH
jgi:hypothetical protein